MPDLDLEVFLLGALVIGGQMVAFAAGNRPASPVFRVLLVVTVVILFLVMPIWWATLTSVIFTVAVLLCERMAADREVLVTFLLFAVGVLATVPLVYAILWIAQHTVGRGAILPALFGPAFLVFVLFLGSARTSGENKLHSLFRLVLLGSSVCLLVGGILSVIFWNAFTT